MSIRPQLDYADIMYDKPHNNQFCKKITGTIQGTSQEKPYLESRETLSRTWARISK